MDNLSMAIIAMEAHIACSNERLRQAWEIIHAKLVEENGNSLQQLKAEIAALADELTCIEVVEGDIANCEDIIKRMRQLSAVQRDVGRNKLPTILEAARVDHIRSIFQRFCDEQSEHCSDDDDCIACALLWASRRAAEETGSGSLHLPTTVCQNAADTKVGDE